MELCEGNLQEKITKERNGLNANEFPRFCGQIVGAMEYLHSVNVTHRDLKPDNILISRLSDALVYKIGDFGAARILQPGQKSGSMHGTYEYLHPHIFHKFYYKDLDTDDQPPKTFDSTYDFWALGATLFEAATGHLPFQPMNARKNRTKMYHMITKGDGIIAAKEHKNGQITYERQLPPSNVNKAVTPFLAKLLKVSLCLLL